MSEFFNFENTERDFPYYKHNPKLSKTAWFILMLSVPFSLIVYIIISFQYEFIGSMVFCLLMLVPLLYFSNWDYSLIFHKPNRSEIKLAILLFIGYMIYAIAIDSVISSFGQGSQMTPESMGITIEMIVSLIFSMMGEELLKFIPLMFFMRVIYKYSNNRKLSVIISTLVVLVCFGVLHYTPGITPIISVILIQGLGSIFEVYGYLKTKNLLVSYITHLLTDGIIFILVLIGL